MTAQNTKAKKSLLLSLFVVAVITISCVTLPGNMSKDWQPPVKPRASAPVDAFAIVHIKFTAHPIGCESSDEDVDCDEVLKELPPVTAQGSGSGLLVDSGIGAVVLTAAHVCANDFPPMFEESGVKIHLKADMEINLEVPTKGSYGASVVKMDHVSDLCLLKPSLVYTNPVRIASDIPRLGDVVYSISAPFGIGGSGMALIFKGFYSGSDTIDDDREVEFYTVPAKPGSSGGPIFNESWEVVGMIHTAFTSLESVAIGTGLPAIHDFLYPPVEVTVESP